MNGKPFEATPEKILDDKYMDAALQGVKTGQATELALLDRKYPLKARVIIDNPTEYYHDDQSGYEKEFYAINEKYSKFNNMLGTARANDFAKKNPTFTPKEIALEYIKYSNPDKYKLIQMAGGSTGIDRDEAAVAINSLYGTNSEGIWAVANQDEKRLDIQFPDKKTSTLYHKLGAELYKGDNWFINHGPTIKEMDAVVAKWSAEDKQHYETFIRPVESKIFGTNVPMSGLVNKTVEGMVSTATETGKFVGDVTGLRSDKDQAINALEQPYDTQYQDVGNSPFAIAELNGLEAKEKKETLSATEQARKAELKTYTKVRSAAQEVIEGMGNLTGQVIFQAVSTKGLGKLLSIGNSATALRVGQALQEVGISRGLSTAVAANAIAFGSSYDAAARDALSLFPDEAETWKRKIYSTIVAGLNAATERIFKDEKVLDAFTANVGPSVQRLVSQLSTDGISRAAFKSEIRNIVEGRLKFVGQTAIENTKETTEELATSIGTSITTLVMAPAKFSEKRAFDDALNTVTTTFVNGGLVAGVSAAGKSRASHAVIPILQQLGQNQNFANSVKFEINRQAMAGDLTQDEANEKLRIVNQAAEIAKSSMAPAANLTEKAKGKYFAMLLNEKNLQHRLEATTDEVAKDQLRSQIDRSQFTREGLIGRTVTVDEDYVPQAVAAPATTDSPINTTTDENNEENQQPNDEEGRSNALNAQDEGNNQLPDQEGQENEVTQAPGAAADTNAAPAIVDAGRLALQAEADTLINKGVEQFRYRREELKKEGKSRDEISDITKAEWLLTQDGKRYQEIENQLSNEASNPIVPAIENTVAAENNTTPSQAEAQNTTPPESRNGEAIQAQPSYTETPVTAANIKSLKVGDELFQKDGKKFTIKAIDGNRVITNEGLTGSIGFLDLFTRNPAPATNETTQPQTQTLEGQQAEAVIAPPVTPVPESTQAPQLATDIGTATQPVAGDELVKPNKDNIVRVFNRVSTEAANKLVKSIKSKSDKSEAIRYIKEDMPSLVYDDLKRIYDTTTPSSLTMGESVVRQILLFEGGGFGGAFTEVEKTENESNGTENITNETRNTSTEAVADQPGDTAANVIPVKVTEMFAKQPAENNFTFLNISGDIWRRDNADGKITNTGKAPAIVEEQGQTPEAQEDTATTPPTSFENTAKTAADLFRKLKTKPLTFKDADGNDINIQQASFISWNDLVEIGAKAIEATGKAADGIKAVLQTLSESDWFKALSDRDKLAVTDQVENYFTQEANDSVPPPIEGEDVVSEAQGGEMISITHEATSEIAEELGFEAYEQKPETIAAWDAEADQKIRAGYNIEALLNRMNDGQFPSAVEQRIVAKYIATLKNAVNNDPSNENLSRLKRAIQISDIAGGREVGKSLAARKGYQAVDDSLAGYFIAEMESAQVEELTDAQKELVRKEHETIMAANDALAAKIAALEEEKSKRDAEAVLSKEQKRESKGRKTDDTFKKERETIITSIREKLRQARTETNAVPIPFLKELVYIAPDVAKLTKNLIEQGVTKLADIVDNIHATLATEIEGITKKDVQDIIAGKYNEKKKSRNQLAAQLRDVKQEAALLNKLDNLINGNEPKTEKQKVQRNQAITSLQKQIKDFEKTKSDAEAAKKRVADLQERLDRLRNRQPEPATTPANQQRTPTAEETALQAAIEAERKAWADELKKTPQEIALQARKTRMANEIADIEEQLRTGNFEPTVAPTPLMMDREGRDLQDRLIRAKTEREIRLLRQEYEQRSKPKKVLDQTLRIANVPRSLMSSMDYSAPLRQAVIATTGNPVMAAKAFGSMFKASFSKRSFDRWFYELKASPRYALMQETGLALTDPHDPRLSVQEEAYMGNIAEKIPIIGKLVAGSERAYVIYLNKMRADVFNRFVDRFEQQGKTYENSKELYVKTAQYVNNITGRGDISGFLEKASPVLNSLLFSPRLIASRINLLNPIYFAKLPNELKVAYAKDMGSFVATGLTVLGLAYLAGKDCDGDDKDCITIENDPRSSDFGKIRAGNTRWDVWGGFQPYIRVFSQLLTGEKKTTTDGKEVSLDGEGAFGQTRGSVLFSFFRGKLAPVPAIAVNFLVGKTVIGQDVTPLNQAVGAISPLIIPALIEAYKDQGVKGLFTVGVPSVFGVGASTYLPKESTSNKIKIYVNGTKRDTTPEEYEKYSTLKSAAQIKTLETYQRTGVPLNKYKEITTSENEDLKRKKYDDLTDEERRKLDGLISRKASDQVKKKLNWDEGEDDQ